MKFLNNWFYWTISLQLYCPNTIRALFNRKVTDFVILNADMHVIAIIELDDHSHIGKEQEDAERDAMFHEAGYRVVRYTEIPSIRQLQSDLS